MNAVLLTFVLINSQPFLTFDSYIDEDECKQYAKVETEEAKKRNLQIRYMCVVGKHYLSPPDKELIEITMENIKNGFYPINVIGMSDNGFEFLDYSYHYSLTYCRKVHKLCAYTTQVLKWGLHT